MSTTVKDRAVELVAEGRTAPEIAHILGTSLHYVHKCAAKAGLIPTRAKPGPIRNDELKVLSPWNAAIGRWIGRQLMTNYCDHAELASVVKISAQRLMRMEIGAVAPTTTELERLAVAFGELPPKMVFENPKMMVPE